MALTSTGMTLADLLERFGAIPAARIRYDPPPGTATEQDVIALEAREYAVRLHVRNVPFAIVPNAVDHALAQPWSQNRTGLLCAGRIESMKNQAITALAMRGSPEPLTC